jgi:hypothetical protein
MVIFIFALKAIIASVVMAFPHFHFIAIIMIVITVILMNIIMIIILINALRDFILSLIIKIIPNLCIVIILSF